MSISSILESLQSNRIHPIKEDSDGVLTADGIDIMDLIPKGEDYFILAAKTKLADIDGVMKALDFTPEGDYGPGNTGPRGMLRCYKNPSSNHDWVVRLTRGRNFTLEKV